MLIHETIFKAYDIRGIYPQEINAEIMRRIGQAFAKFCTATEVLVGYDMRLSSYELKMAFISGILSQGVDVVDIGLITTDTLYFVSGKYNLPGAMITASHNPKELNGVKFCQAGAMPIGENSGLLQIKDLVLHQDFVDKESLGKVEIRENALPEFAGYVLTFIDSQKIKNKKIVIDAGNGMAGKLCPLVFDQLSVEVVPLFFELDGNFPNHQPSPIEKENNRFLTAKIKEVGADLGLAFDGDADRIFFFDENGQVIDSSFITAMIAESFLQKYKGEMVLYNVNVSRVVPEIVEENGGKSLMTKVGHSFVKEKMKETNAIFAGEHSGHYFFRDNYRADSGIIAGLMVLEKFCDTQLSMSEFMQKYARYSRIEETNFTVKNKNEIIEKIKKIYDHYLIQDYDGVSFEMGAWRFGVRSSNTEPLLRLNLEARDEKLLNEKFTEIRGLITNS
ncbi:MAG: phosphomannomutase/phosphoglucomutase [Patescibacteria group bacterium]